MGNIEKDGDTYLYRQEDGEITAQFDSIDTLPELAHEGTRAYRRVFNLLVLVGVLYLAIIFWLN